MRTKKIILHLSIFISYLLSTKAIAQTVLSKGDIVVIGFKTNSTTDAGNDAIKLVTLVDLECSTTFIVTDNNWDNSIPGWACNNDEFAVEITCNSPIAAGSIFYIEVNASGDPATCSGGSISRAELNSTWGSNYGLSSKGDNVYILQGTRAAPSFIFALKHVGAFSNTSCSDKDQAGLPSGLTVGTNAIVMPSTKDQWHFNCVTNSGTASSIRSAICNTSNWVSSSGQSWNHSSCFFSITTGLIQSGVLAVSGAGCGCLSGCNLAYSGSTNCTGVSGNCSAGYQNMSKSISVAAGCTYIVAAEMKNRNYGCSSSGADGNCQTCDVVKVDVSGGSKTFQQGASNASIADSYTLTGPGTIIVSGKADRADEIITYSVSATSCSCLTTLLPIELISFSASLQGKSIKLSWETSSEINNDYFVIERSINALDWEAVSVIKSLGNSMVSKNYSVYDSSPLEGVSYYRLKQVDLNGRFSHSKIESVSLDSPMDFNIYPNPNESGLLKISGNSGSGFDILLTDVFGGEVYKAHSTDNMTDLDLTPFSKGIYVIHITSNERRFSKKIVYH
ncbi:MAG: T9SS type A sorting domain-containing protein [Bacteroidetes bacterium]|nr:T9SS type A sorting domain-containing protein [Bacteroidota bacterium]